VKRTIVLGVAAAIAEVATWVVPSGADAPPATLHLTGVQDSETGPQGRPRPGSMIVFSGRETGEDKGRSYVQCTLITKAYGLCLGRFNLSRGTIAVETATSLEDAPKTITLDITGGTGAYDGVRGTATFTDIGKDRTDELFSFKP
jgi:hypothetical protein